MERAPTLARGWTELSVGAERARATDGWTAGGRPTPLPVPVRSWTLRLGLRHGLAPGWEVFASLPWHRTQAFVDQHGVGDVQLGTRIALQRSEAPTRGLAVELSARVPLGYAGQPTAQVQRGPQAGPLPLASGTGELALALLGRRAVDGLLLEGRLEGALRLPGRPAWHPGRFDPGDTLTLAVRAPLQIGPALLGPTATLQGRGPARAAPADGPYARVPVSAGLWAELGAVATVQFSRGFAVDSTLDAAVLGRGDAFALVPLAQPPRTRRLGLRARGAF